MSLEKKVKFSTISYIYDLDKNSFPVSTKNYDGPCSKIITKHVYQTRNFCTKKSVFLTTMLKVCSGIKLLTKL